MTNYTKKAFIQERLILILEYMRGLKIKHQNISKKMKY